MTDLTDLVRSELTTLADSAPPPTDLADRAVTAGVRRRRRRAATAGTAVAAVVAVTLAATQFITPQATRSTDPQPAAAEARNVVFAKFKGEQGYEILNPTTGRYRTVAVSRVMAPSADLRHAPVIPPVATDNVPVPDQTRMGRYDTTTGEIRWYHLPKSLAGSPSISPDGRYLAAPVGTDGTPGWGVMVVDTETAHARVVDLAPEIVAAKNVVAGSGKCRAADVLAVNPQDAPRFVAWRPDSRHLLIGNAIVDLTGRQTGTVPIPDAWLIAPRPNGEGMLVVPKDALDTYIVTDASGRVDWSGPTRPTACLLIFGGFLGWRGAHHMLVKSPEDPDGGIDAIDVRTGQRARVSTYDARSVIVVPADNLSPAVRDAVSF